MKNSTDQKLIVMPLNPKEASLIQMLRGYEYGSYEVFKLNGELIRVEVKESRLIKPFEGKAFDPEALDNFYNN
jgi:hypothetical protein